MNEKVAAYLAFGSTVVLVVDPTERRTAVHRAGEASEVRAARGSWNLEPFDGLLLDWDRVFSELDGKEPPR